MLVSYCPARAVAKIAAVALCRLTFQQNHDLFFRASAEVLEVRSGHRLDDPTLPREVAQGVFKASHVELAFEELVAGPEHFVLLEPGGKVGLKGMSNVGTLRRTCAGLGLEQVWRLVTGIGPCGSFEAIDGNPPVGCPGGLCRRLSRRDRCSRRGRRLGRRGRDVKTDATLLTVNSKWVRRE